MKVFIAYRYSGEDPETLRQTMKDICAAITAAGYENSCSIGKEGFFRDNNYTNRQIIDYALGELDQCDALLAFVNSDAKSEGMIIEVGYAYAKGKPIILAQRKGVTGYFLPGLANQVIEFQDLEDLNKQLTQLRLPYD